MISIYLYIYIYIHIHIYMYMYICLVTSVKKKQFRLIYFSRLTFTYLENPEQYFCTYDEKNDLRHILSRVPQKSVLSN